MPDVSNRRRDIWKSAIEVFASSPVVGVGHNTLLPYVRAEQPKSYLINNDHMEFTSMHNTFLDVLVAQGRWALSYMWDWQREFFWCWFGSRRLLCRIPGEKAWR